MTTTTMIRHLAALATVSMLLAVGGIAAADDTTSPSPDTALVLIDPPAVLVDWLDLDCVVEVEAQDPETGQFALSPLRCATEPEAALASISGAGAVAAPSSGSIARHYDGFNASGATLTIVGTVCNGGWLNLPSSWQDRVSSSYRQVSPCSIAHYSGLNLSGSVEFQSFGNLGSLNNRASSIRYS